MPAEASSPQPDLAALFERVARRYRDCGRFARHYVAAKLRRDPVHRDILALAAREAFGDVVDIGCGRGQLAVALLDAGLARSVSGLDCNAGHLRQAQRAANGLAFTPTVQDLAQCQDVPNGTTVLLVDVLYQLEPQIQMALLQAAILATRQRIIIRTLDPDRGLRSRVTVWLEKLVRGMSPHSVQHVAACSVSCILRTLNEAGLDASVTPCWQGTPFANVLIIGRPVS
jgi:2-polyprenyl-3-methyl-5-hydroxy-6-metoxy-1,4-benzoquinol methylase